MKTARRRLTTAAAIAVVATAALWGATTVGVAQSSVDHATDLLWPSGQADHRVVVVAIDERSLQRYGEWPWSPSVQQRLLQQIAADQPSAIGYDVVLGNGARTGFDALADTITTEGVVTARAFGAIEPTAEGLYRGVDEVRLATPVDAQDVAGHAVILADDDGVVRTSPLVIETDDGEFLASLALRTVSRAIDPHAATETPIVGPARVIAGGVVAPTEPHGVLRIDWAEGLAASDRQVVSAADVLDGATSLQPGSVVLVGVTATALGDRHVTPLQPGATTPGVLVQAQLADTLLARSWVSRPPLVTTLAVSLIVAFGIAFLALGWRLRWVILATIGVMVVYVGLALSSFATLGILPDLVRPPATILAVGAAAVGVRLVREQRRRRELTDLLGSYVPDLAATTLGDSDDLDLRGDDRFEAAALFCDLRGFTALSSTIPVDEVRALLDRFYGYVFDVVSRHDGLVVKYVGDEVFAVFAARTGIAEAADRALAAARELQDSAPELRERLSADGLPGIRFGIGVHAGPVAAAHIGPRQRRQYDVVGDTVNVASRLCDAAAADEIVATAGLFPRQDGEPESLVVKGKIEPLDVVRLAPAQRT